MSNSNRKCFSCGKEYYFCPTCPTKGKTESFYNMFCSERCSKIFKVLSDETFKHVTTEECKKELQKLNVKKDEVFKENVKKHIDRVFVIEKEIKETGIKEEDPGVAAIVGLVSVANEEKDIENEKSVDDTEMVKMTVPRKTRKKKNSEVD